ncbi:sensor histidine kinase [Kaarinaea lacus]
MSDATVAINKYALIWFSAVLTVFLVVADMLMIIDERDYLHKLETRHSEHELDMAGRLLTEAMIRNDYAAIEQYIPKWGAQRPDVVSIRVTAPNGFVVAQYQSQGRDASKHRLDLETQIDYMGRPVLGLQMQRDLSAIDTHIKKRAVELLVVSVVLVSVLGWILWLVLKRTAIAPLQKHISERKKIELELATHAKELELHVDELESYSYSIAHDLRTPVRSITSFSQVLLQDAGEKLSPADKDALRRVVDAGKYMAELIDDILALARITREAMKIEVLDLSALARISVARLRQLEPGRSVDVNIQAPLPERADSRLAQLLLDNLLENAWKYTSKTKQAQIEFGVLGSGESKTYFVRDNGIGFNMQYAHKLFQPFQRLHGASEFEGTGVGLATVQRIVKRHGGKVWVESEENRGTTFYFSFAAN